MPVLDNSFIRLSKLDALIVPSESDSIKRSLIKSKSDIFATLGNIPVVDVQKDFNVPFDGTTDATPRFLAAVSQVNVLAAYFGAAILYAGPGVYKLNQEIDLDRRVSVLGDGSGFVTFDFSSATGAFPNSCCFFQTGDALVALPALSTNINRGDPTITLASAPTVNPKDIIIVYNSANSSWSNYRSTYRQGEFQQVTSVSGNVITIDNYAYDTYLSGSTTSLYKLTNPACGIFKGMTIKGKAGNPNLYCINITRGCNLYFDDVIGTFSQNAIFALFNCFKGNIQRCEAFDNEAATGTNYGLVIANCQSITVSNNCRLIGARHGVAIGGGDYTGAVVNRFINIRDSVIGSTRATAGLAGADLHGNTEFCSYENCDLTSGLEFGGDFHVFKGNRIWQSLNSLAIQNSECKGPNVTIEDNDFYMTADANVAVIDAFILLGNGGWTGATRDGVIKVYNNRFYCYGFQGQAVEIFNSDIATQSFDVDIKDNTFDRVFGSIPNSNSLCIFIRASAGKDFRYVTISDNTLKGGGIQVTSNPLFTTIEGNKIYESARSGIVAVLTSSTPKYSNEFLKIEDNTIFHSAQSGITVQGLIAQTRVRVIGNTSLSNNQGGTTGSSSTDSSLYVTGALYAEISKNCFGDIDGTTHQQTSYSVDTVTELHDEDNRVMGTVIAQNRSGITTTRFKSARNDIKTVTTAYTVVTDDKTVRGDATGAAFTIALPSATLKAILGKVFTFKKIDASANAVTIDASGSETIDGALTKVLAAQFAMVTIQSNGVSWDIIS